MLQCPGAAEWKGLISRPIDRRVSYRTGCERTLVSARHGERFPGLRVAAKAGTLWAKREIAKTGELDHFAPFQPFLDHRDAQRHDIEASAWEHPTHVDRRSMRSAVVIGSPAVLCHDAPVMAAETCARLVCCPIICRRGGLP